VDAWIQFGRGPLFRIAFSLMLLGLLRVLFLTMTGVIEAWRRSPDRIVNWQEVRRQTLAWLVPVGRLWRQRAGYSTLSLFFHMGLIVAPLALAAHALLWKHAIGYAWPALPLMVVNWLTLVAIAAGLGLVVARLLDSRTRGVSRAQDYFWPLLLILPFVTGYLCLNAAIGPRTYEWLMLTHIYAADLILLLVPFTKLSHCILSPLSQVVTAVAWKFPAGAGDRVAATLGYADRPSWIKDARLALTTAGPASEAQKP
jgi:nitrate reductase gamma subunit